MAEESVEEGMPAYREPIFRPLAGLSEADVAYERASRLDEEAAERMFEVSMNVRGAETVRRQAVSPEATEAVALLKGRQSLRAAILASVILGPPRALSKEPAWVQ